MLLGLPRGEMKSEPMTPKEKCDSLIYKYEKTLSFYSMSKAHRKQFAKECAIICCNEIYEEILNNIHGNDENENERMQYWNDVKSELQKL